MKIIQLIARLLLGLMFTVFGLNGFLHFIPMQLPEGMAGQFIGILAQSHYFIVIAALQLAGGVLLLVGRYIPLALTLLAPIIVNIVLFHALMEPQGTAIAILAVVLWLIVFSGCRRAFDGLFQQRV